MPIRLENVLTLKILVFNPFVVVGLDVSMNVQIDYVFSKRIIRLYLGLGARKPVFESLQTDQHLVIRFLESTVYKLSISENSIF